ncbi:large conductance mechanosensitive channel protein MscL [Schleiferilactobacillus harbinensis]|jgi:large conductance mechanosensitive channel|uniref:Large-conductance mechanosensitive channel n=1 Tax=Schleiferilactobacillus harbinensis TaxID=304207 RepID=A0ABU7SY05_9LACO|nr:large conductance mechanosensitive channel protein MscL [Schleiferilactobacillus harbinensis]HAY52626.1 large conductance mechanosensitive channel protein MscL [Lactobacillus sp.]MBO3091531.1 large conductance mechanosensitive channel protein MscL [Schleiferilactobacillus harbinensis]MCI1687562.1 large conductance mechanosensitive channel protein MscL [Schleiferilactobacillus harbinensis]MCI1784488.1 large conductance mechanosensitive channel protein MscL [Schleiferilactobacillus harbinensis
MIKEFKEFISRGSVIDLAVGVLIGGAFNAIVTSLNDTLLSPLVGLFTGGLSLEKNLILTIGKTHLRFGAFLQSVITFLITAFVIFLIVKALNKLRKPKEAAPAGPTEADYLREIRDLLAEKEKQE